MFEENTIIGKIAKGEYPEEIVSTKYGKFVFKFPSGLDIQAISRKVAACFGGMPVNSFDTEIALTNEVNMALSVAITAYPENFPEEFKRDGMVNFPDWEVKNALYKAFNTFHSKTQKKISEESGNKTTG